MFQEVSYFLSIPFIVTSPETHHYDPRMEQKFSILGAWLEMYRECSLPSVIFLLEMLKSCDNHVEKEGRDRRTLGGLATPFSMVLWRGFQLHARTVAVVSADE
jgi:hypothetical protein